MCCRPWLRITQRCVSPLILDGLLLFLEINYERFFLHATSWTNFCGSGILFLHFGCERKITWAQTNTFYCESILCCFICRFKMWTFWEQKFVVSFSVGWNLPFTREGLLTPNVLVAQPGIVIVVKTGMSGPGYGENEVEICMSCQPRQIWFCRFKTEILVAN